MAYKLQPRSQETKLVATEEEKASAEQPLTMAELIRCFSVLSHDLKSPIFSIDGFSELLLSDYQDKLDEEGREFLQRVRSSAQQMKRVLDDMSHLIKLLSRPNANRPVDLKEIVDEIRLKYNFLIESGGVKFDVPDDLPSVNADPEKLREALGVLVSNALTFTDRDKDDRHVTVHYERDGSRHKICVIDNGIGIDPRYIGQIFEIGVKLDKSRGEGPGYGLYMARKIVESHGGSMTVDGALGQGSRFCFTLPG